MSKVRTDANKIEIKSIEYDSEKISHETAAMELMMVLLECNLVRIEKTLDGKNRMKISCVKWG